MAIHDLNQHPCVYVSIAQLSEYWRVSRRYLLKQVDAGTLEAIRFGPRSFRISVPAALKFERSHSVGNLTTVQTDHHSAAMARPRRDSVDSRAVPRTAGSSGH
jgi:excisionase family DNA binding protein